MPGSQHVNVGSNSNIRSFNNNMSGSRVPGELATEKSNNSSGVNVSKNVSNYKNPYPHFSNSHLIIRQRES